MVFRLASHLPPTAVESAADAAHSKTMPFTPGARTYAVAFGECGATAPLSRRSTSGDDDHQATHVG